MTITQEIEMHLAQVKLLRRRKSARESRYPSSDSLPSEAGPSAQTRGQQVIPFVRTGRMVRSKGMIGEWRMRRLLAWEHPQLWHRVVDYSNGYYRTACGLRYGMAGSAGKKEVPASACVRCSGESSAQTKK